MFLQPQFKPVIAKVVLLGSQGVGKTSLVLRLNGYPFTDQLNPTIGAAFCRHELIIEGRSVQLQIWDTAGQERFRAMAPMYYRNASAAFVVYDITALDTFVEAKTWVAELSRSTESPVIICLVGNKTDLEEKREVDTQLASDFADSIGAEFFETSALDNRGVSETFEKVARLLQDRAANSSFPNSDPAGLTLSSQVTGDQTNATGRSCCAR